MRATIRAMADWPGLIHRYRPILPLDRDAPVITLLEGNTPLIEVPALAERLQAARFFVKFEGLNPTGSFKDRGMTVAVSAAAHRGVRAVICASTGNTAASAAAYSARAGLQCIVIIPAGAVAAGKLAGAAVYGARIVQIHGSFDQALAIVRELASGGEYELVNSLNPMRIEGQKTVAYEISDSRFGTPDWLALPVGNAGNITAIWQGFQELQSGAASRPHLLGVQAAGAAPLVTGQPVREPQTVASAIRIGNPARGEQALAAAEQSGGRIVSASDDQILGAQSLLAQAGIWVEPASAAGLAGLLNETGQGRLDLSGQEVVCLCTGHGLKDPQAITDRMAPPEAAAADVEAVRELVSR